MKHKVFALFIWFAAYSAIAQELDKKQEFHPDIDGIIKTKFEYDSNNKLSRFEVRNARFGAKGNVTENFSYRVEIDLSDEGKIKMLDAWANYSPIKNLNFKLGQIKIPFGTDYLRNPADNMFANRSFVAKYVNDGLRDIGAAANYKFIAGIPIELHLAATNGTGSNNPKWIKTLNYSSRLILEPFSGFFIKGNVYAGSTEKESRLKMYSAELSYAKNSFFIESEYIYRTWSSYSGTNLEANGLYIHANYKFLVAKKQLSYILPTIRYDEMGSGVFINSSTAERVTFGINFGFDQKKFLAEIRLNYEDYFKSANLNHTNKFTIEFVAKF